MKKTIVHRSAAPFYTAAAAWAVYALAFPLYKVGHFVIAAVVTLAVFFMMKLPLSIYTPAPPLSDSTRLLLSLLLMVPPYMLKVPPLSTPPPYLARLPVILPSYMLNVPI